MLTLVMFLALCVLGSGFFSGSETGFVSWNPLKVSHAAAQGDFAAALGMRLINRRGRLLAAILIGNNICNVGAALIFARLFERLDAAVPLNLSKIPSPESWFLTPVLLLFGEVLPKFIYRKYAFSMTLKSVPALIFFFYLASPVFWVLGVFSKVAGAAGGARQGGAPLPRDTDVREEILLVAVEGARRGDIFECADRVMKNTLEMKGRGVGALAVSIDEWKKRYPVYRCSQLLSELSGDGGGCADEVIVFDDGLSAPVGYVALMDAAARRGAIMTFGALIKPLPRLRDGMEALSCLRRMPQDSPRYHLVFGGNGAVAILDKRTLFEAAFARG
jgi:CBS domain containing-hemolysin-like protein